jgi:hypothetical protein
MPNRRGFIHENPIRLLFRFLLLCFLPRRLRKCSSIEPCLLVSRRSSTQLVSHRVVARRPLQPTDFLCIKRCPSSSGQSWSDHPHLFLSVCPMGTLCDGCACDTIERKWILVVHDSFGAKSLSFPAFYIGDLRCFDDCL